MMRHLFRSSAAEIDWRADPRKAADDPQPDAKAGAPSGETDQSISRLAADLEALLRRDGRPAQQQEDPAGPALRPVGGWPEPDRFDAGAPAMPDPVPAQPPAGQPADSSPHIDRLAERIEARQTERARRAPALAADTAAGEAGDGDGHDTALPEMGLRFGWKHRSADRPAEDGRQPEEKPRPRVARVLGRLAAGVAGIAAIVGVSAVAALYIVSLGDRQETASVEETPADHAAMSGATASWSEDELQAAQRVPDSEPDRIAGTTGTTGTVTRPAVEPSTTGIRRIGPATATQPAATFGTETGAGSDLTADGSASSAAAVPSPEAQVMASAPAATGDPVPSAPQSFAGEPAASGETAEQAGQSGGPGTMPDDSARTTSDVNMRAGPENDAAVITVVPAGSAVGVVSCDIWCEVVFEDRQGWVYRDFIRRDEAAVTLSAE
jgi:hypothetical protein